MRMIAEQVNRNLCARSRGGGNSHKGFRVTVTKRSNANIPAKQHRKNWDIVEGMCIWLMSRKYFFYVNI